MGTLQSSARLGLYVSYARCVYGSIYPSLYYGIVDQGNHTLLGRNGRNAAVSCRSECGSVTLHHPQRTFVLMLWYPCPLTDRRPALLAVLKSMLVTYSHLLNALLAPPPPAASGAPPEFARHLEWIKVLSQNLMAAANDMRPVQVTQYSCNTMGHAD